MKKILVSLGVMSLIAHPAMAQTTSNSDTAANSSSNTTVVAVAGQQVHPANTTADINYDGHTWTTPSVAGSYFGGTNPCLVGTGGGAAGGPIGFSLNLGRSDKGCTRRSEAAAWHALGFDNVAIARLCQDIEAADAFFAATGKACPGADRERYKLADGSIAPVATLVSNSKAIPDNPYAPPTSADALLKTPEGQRAVMMAAQQLVQKQAAMKQATVPQIETAQPASFDSTQPVEAPSNQDPATLPQNEIGAGPAPAP